MNKKIILTFLFLLTLTTSALAAIASDSKDSCTSSASTTCSKSMTNTAGDFIAVYSSSNTGAGSVYASSNTYGGDSLAEVTASRAAQGNVAGSWWFRIAPKTGSNTLLTTYPATPNSITSIMKTVSGAKQSAQPDASAANNGNAGTAANVTVVTVADNSMVLAATVDAANETPTTNSPLTSDVTTSAATNHNDVMGYAMKTPAGSQNYTFNTGFFVSWATSGMSIAPATTAAAVRHNLPTLGVG